MNNNKYYTSAKDFKNMELDELKMIAASMLPIFDTKSASKVILDLQNKKVKLLNDRINTLYRFKNINEKNKEIDKLLTSPLIDKKVKYQNYSCLDSMAYLGYVQILRHPSTYIKFEYRNNPALVELKKRKVFNTTKDSETFEELLKKKDKNLALLNIKHPNELIREMCEIIIYDKWIKI